MNNPGMYCVYVTSHSDGRFYIGSSDTSKVRSLKYVGSGKLLHEEIKAGAMKLGIYTACGKTDAEIIANTAYATGWQCEIVQTVIHRSAAYTAERLLIRELGQLQGNLNLTKPRHSLKDLPDPGFPPVANDDLADYEWQVPSEALPRETHTIEH